MIIAIGSKQCKTVSIIAHIDDIIDRCITFEVINGEWNGSLENDVLTVFATETTFEDTAVLYAGDRLYGSYNAEIPRIQSLIDAPDYILPTFENVYRLWQAYAEADADESEICL